MIAENTHEKLHRYLFDLMKNTISVIRIEYLLSEW